MLSRKEKIRVKKEKQLIDFLAVEGKFTLESKYIKSSVKLRVQHNECRFIFERRTDHIYKNGLTCPRCYKSKPSHLKKSHEEYSAEFLNVYTDNSVSLDSEYIDGEKKVSVSCKNGHSWVSLPLYLLKGKGCPSLRLKTVEEINIV